MDVITQAGIASEYICNGAFILLPEITWYCFTHAQVELKQPAKPEAIWEAEDPARTTRTARAWGKAPQPHLVLLELSAFVLSLLPRDPPGNAAPLPAAASFCQVE